MYKFLTISILSISLTTSSIAVASDSSEASSSDEMNLLDSIFNPSPLCLTYPFCEGATGEEAQMLIDESNLQKVYPSAETPAS